MSDKLPIANTAKQSCPDLFEIYELMSFLPALQGNQQPAFYRDYNLIWMQQGEANVLIHAQKFSISPNTLCFFRPGQQICFTPITTTNGFVISFAAEFLDLHDKKSTGLITESLFNHFLLIPVLNICNEASISMDNLAAKMLQEFTGYAAYKKEILKGFLKLFIIHTSRATQGINQPFILPKKTALVKQFYILLEKHFASKKMVRDYALMLHVSAGHLNDAVSEVSGFAASYHIQQRVIREAKRRIFFHGSSMKEIAFSLGFSDQAHFSKYFKNISGKNFTDFKKAITS